MRAIFISLILVTLLITGCTSIEVAKGVSKATQSIETSVSNIFKSRSKKSNKSEILIDEQKKEQIIEDEKQEISKDEQKKEQTIEDEKQEISKEQIKFKEVVNKQKKISNLNLLGMTIPELNQLIGQPSLIREDGKTKIVRFDSANCRLFVFLNVNLKKPFVEYYELRNNNGELIDRNKKIETCFNKIKLT